MKRLLAVLMAALSVASFAGCGKNEGEATEPYLDVPTELVINDVDENSEEAKAVKAAAAQMLDTFITGDIDAIKAFLIDEDENWFAFDSEEQNALYREIFPKISYEFSFVSEHEGVYGVMTTITSPNMAEVYGRIITDIMDLAQSGQPYTLEELRKRNTETMQNILRNEEDIVKREQDLYIYVEHTGSEYTPRCDIFLANELVGGAMEASGELSAAMNEIMALEE